MAPQYIYTMKGLDEGLPADHVVLKDIWLSFLPGAKIGVLGYNGAGKSTLLRIMAGVDPSSGRGVPRRRHAPSASCRRSRSSTSPRTCSATSRRAWLATARAAHALRRDQREVRRGPDARRDGQALLEEQGRVQDRIDAAGAWDLDSRLELAMDALRLPPGTPTSRRSRAASGAAWRSAGCCCSRPTCCCSTSPPTTSTPSRWRGSSSS
jgi:energy-dependent translational throttle protein EttA